MPMRLMIVLLAMVLALGVVVSGCEKSEETYGVSPQENINDD